jgi:hypothetical protein
VLSDEGLDTGALSATSMPSPPDQGEAGDVHSDDHREVRVDRVGDGGKGADGAMEGGGSPSSSLTGIVHANESAPLMSGDAVCGEHEELMREVVNSIRSEPVNVDAEGELVSVCMNVDDGDECVTTPPHSADLSPINSCTMQTNVQCAEHSHSHCAQSVGLLVNTLLVDNCPVAAAVFSDADMHEVGC